MTMNPLPPQAYTKETLVKAYAWLQSQNENIKELATTPDVLVSLFLRAKLQGDASLERPSIQNFKKELKNLAGMMGEFEVVEPAPTSQQTQPTPTIRFRSQDYNKPEPEASSPGPSAGSSSNHFTSNSAPSSAELGRQLDIRSQSMIQEVKTQFNLSSDSEALRLLLAVGHNQLKTLIK